MNVGRAALLLVLTSACGSPSSGSETSSTAPGVAASSVSTPELNLRRLAEGTVALELRAPDLGPAPENGDARLLVAARVGATRLIDNAAVLLGSGDE